jgi:hypothetical protein
MNQDHHWDPTLILLLAPELRCGLPYKVPTPARKILVNKLDPLLSEMVSLSSLLLGGR